MTRVRSDVSIRPYEDGDFGVLCALLGDPEMTRFLGGPESDEALAARHARYLSADSATHGIFTILVGADRVATGWVGFWESDWEGEATWECGWHVLPQFQGAGIASAAARLALDCAKAKRRHQYVDAFPAADNAASNALCRRLGFSALREVDVEYPKGQTMHAMHCRYDLHPPHSR
ncbi:MAG TPA: GNAT family N-acetyltransferase, partial [Coriobacteriia bacterium]|nr:GNAT family N-acetyltransferase [Coriobacteriia bacterium]